MAISIDMMSNVGTVTKFLMGQ